MSIIKKLALLNVAIFTSCYAISAPVIHIINGELNTGQTVSITGKDFSSTNATTLLWDTVDNQTTTTKLLSGTPVPTKSTDTWSANTASSWGTDVVYDSNNPKQGRQITYSGGKRSDIGWPNAIKDKNLTNIFVSWWFWPSEDPQDNGGSNKFIRIWDDQSGEGTRISWTSMHLTAGGIVDWSNWGGNVKQWNRLDIWVSGETGEIKTWMNNKLTHNVSGFVKSKSTNGLNVYILGFDPSISDNYPDFQFNLSDIYISPSIARVEITNKATWEDINAIREIQPINDWSDDIIKITLNSGSFENLAGKYLYVVDKNGDANQNGFPLCTKCPLAPPLGVE